jgi:predicted amidophosphoribosyltransferase
MTEAGFRIYSAFRHEGTARRLVHLLKYQAITAAADLLAAEMVDRLPPSTAALIPVPRAWIRRARHGVDPAVELAVRLGDRVDVPVVRALRARLWWPAHAGSDRAARRSPGFFRVTSAPTGAVLVDDVATTGLTLRTAGEVIGVSTAITATRALGSTFDRISAQEQTATAE